jgi:uncharacterized protein YebE (UPF0316 family)
MMDTIMNFLMSFLTMASPLELFLILVSKIIQVSISTLRVILISKGYRKEGTVLSFVETMLWAFIASRVIMGLAEAPVKGIVYSIGFAIGVYLGSLFEGYLAMGRVLIQAIVSQESAMVITGSLRDSGYGVTTVKAQGRDSEKEVLMIFANRKGKEKITSEILAIDENAMIITNDVSTLQGGTISAAQKLLRKG